MILQHLDTACEAQGLAVFGALHPRIRTVKEFNSGTLFLLGATGGFWPIFKRSAEANDGDPDPVDRWSQRVIGAIASNLGADALFPFGGPPYTPFINWALASGRAFSSPTGLLVHDQVGMMLSYRGALHFEGEIDIPDPPLKASPCDSCKGQPCTTACPVGAMNSTGNFAVASCHGFLDSPKGGDCMHMGCIARRACPLSSGAERNPEQSFHHMRYFHAK